MASELNTKSDIRPAGRSLPPTTADGRPSKIPVRSDTSSGSASDDSDDAKSSLRAKRYGKSKIPRAVPKNVATSNSTEAAGNRTLQEKCPQRSGMQQKLSSTTKRSGANPKVGGAKIVDKKQTAKPKGGLKRREHEESPSLNKARSNALGSRQDMGIQKKLTKTSKVTPKTGGNAKKRSGLPEEEQEKPKCETTSKKSALKHPVLGKVNNEKLPKQRQNSASASKKKITPRERKNNETPCKLKSDVAIEKEEVEVSDSSLSESSSESEPRSFEYEAESDELLASDSDAECVSKESQSHAKEQNENLDQQEILDCVHDNGDGLQCVPEEAHGHANESSKEQHADSAERKVAFCEPKEVLERRALGRPIIRGFRDDRKININFAYETESDEFTSTEYSESKKEKSEEKKDEKREDSPAQSSEKKDHSSLDAGEDLALTDCEIESISEDSDIEQQVCIQKHNNELCGSTSTEIARSTEEKNVLQDCTKTQVETAKEGGQNAEVKPPSEMTRKSSEPQSYGEDCEVTISDKHKSEDSDDSFFGINVAKFYGCNTTGQNATCMADDMKPKQNTFHIDRNDPQDIEDADYLGKNFESQQNESYILNAINDEVRAGFSPKSESVSEDVESTKIQDKGNRKFEVIQKCRMLISFEEIPYENGKDKKVPSVDEDAFVTELVEILSATEPDTEGDPRNYQARNTSGVPNKTTSLIEEGYVHHKPPIAPKQQLKQRALEKRNEPERALKFDGTSVKALKQTKERLPKDSPTAKPEQIVEEVCLPSDNKSDVLLWRKEKQTFDGILKTSNESSKKGKTASTSGTSGTQSTQVAGPRGSRLTISGMSNSGSTTAGGSGDDDPNDPTRRPQRQKEPDDKKDEETEEQRRKLVKKKLINQMVGMADDFLQNEHQSLNETLFTRRPSKELEISLEATSASDLSSSSTEGTSLEVNCVQGDEEQSFNCYAGVGKEFEDEGTLIKALTSENNLLKKEVSKLKTDVYQKPKEVMQVQDKNKTYKNVISKMEVDPKQLDVEEIELTQECKELTNKEIVKELRRLHAEISEASKELASEDVMESELRGPTSSPLSVEIAEVDGFSLQKQPEEDETSEIVTLMHSITAMTEELRDQIARNKTKLAKAYSNSSLIELDEVGHDSEKLRELQKEIADLQEQLKEERTKFRTFESLCKNRIEENKNLRDRIQDLESELAKSDDRRKETQTYKNRELINIRNNMESKGNKVDHLVHEVRLLSEANDVQKSVIESLNCRIRFRESREIELESLVDELTTENEKLLQQVSKEKSNTKKYQRENDERIAAHSMDVTRLEYALQDKIDELVDVLSSIDNFYAGDQPLPDHPCMGAIENGIKILYDVSGLLKAIGGPDSQSGEGREAVNETKKRELEIMIEDLSKEVNILKADKQRLQIKLKMNGECREDTGNEQSKMEDEMLRQQLDERETQLNGLEQQITTLQSDNASLSKLLGDIKELASKDAEVHRLQLDEHLNRMEVLQEENDKQNAQIKALNESLLDCQDKNQAQKTEIEDLELGKEALQYKVKMKVKEVLEHMAKHEAMRKRVQEVTAEKETFQERLEKRQKELSEHQMKIKELIKKLETMDAEKQALEQKLSQARHEVDNEATDTKSKCTGEVVSEPPCNCTMAGSSGKANDLQVQNEELKEKLELYEAFLAQVKTEKAEYSKALEESRKNVMMVRKNSDEEIAKLEKDLEGKDLSENELQKTIKLLEEKIATLEAEGAESVKQMKAIVEGIQGENELEQCKKEWNELELELRDSISAPGSEKTDTQKELWSKVRTSFEVHMKEFDQCLKDRHALQEEMACLKDLHLEQKKELECVTQEKGKMNEKITEKETEVETIRQSSSEIINDLELQLKGRQDSALELQEKATFLSKKVAQFEMEKLESDKKIKALMESLNAKEDMSNHLKEKRNAEENNMVLLMKNSEEKIMTLEKELQDRSESETALQNKVCSLKLRISELDDEKNEREESTKTLLEAINTKKNLEEYVQKKDEVEKQLLRKVEEMKTEFARLRSAKEDLERQLVSQPISQVSSEKSQNLKDDSGVEESAEREKQLKNQLENLSDEKLKTEKLLKEKESQVLLLATNNSEAKIEDLENKLRCKSVSEVELQGRMRLLENKIFLLEDEKVRHSTSISSMVRVLKAREELSGVIKARDDAEKEYNIKLDEMEIIVKKLRKEKRKHDCDMELKKRYKNEYEESRRIVKEITEDIYRYNERVEELQAIVDGHEEQEEQKEELDEADLSENIGDLRSSLGTSDVELFQTQQTLQAKISDLEVEKAEFESVITALLDSMEAKEKIEYSVEATREVDKKIVKQMDEILDAVQRLKSEKERLEQELHASENMRAVITLDAEVLQTQSDEKISLLEQSLKESFQLEKDLKERLELMSEELARLEGEKYQADKTVQTMLASLQGREKLEECVREKERLETMLESKNKRTVNMDLQEAKSVVSLIELLQSKELQVEQCQREKEEAVKSLKGKELELELRGKDAERQSHDFEECLREKNENFKILVGEIEKLKASLTMVEEDKKGLLQKLEKHSKVSEEREEQVNEITQREQNLLQRLSYAENNLQQLKEDKQALKKQLKQEQLERQDASNRYMDEIRRESDAMEQKHADVENELHQMIKQLNSQIAVTQNEKETFIERHKKTAENLNLELLFYCKREEKLRRQMDELEDEVKQTKEELKKQVRLQEEKEMEFEKLQSERIVLSENVSKMESKLRKELENRSTREAELLEEKDIEIKKLRSENDVFVENLKTKMLKLEMELEYQVKNEEKHSKREEKLRRQMDELEDEVKQTKEELKKQVKLQEEKEMEFAKLRSERNVLSENVSKIESKLRKELENRSTREAELREEKDIEIKKLKSGNDVVVENLKTKMLKLQMELEYQLKNEGKLREEKKKVIEELKLQDNLKKEIDQLKSTIKNLEEEGQMLGEERRDLQSEAARSAQTSRDTITSLQEDLKDLHDDNKELQDKLNEMKSKESCFNEEKQRHENEISVYEDRIKKQKDYLEKFQRKLKKQKEHEQCMKDDLTSQVNELQLKITRLTEVERGQEEEKAEYENNVRRLKLHTENLETQINDQKDELVESRAKISALEDIKVQSDAQHERQQREVVSECKRANEKIDELRKELRLDLKSTSALENEIKTLKGKTAEINKKTESQKTEIAHIYSLSKGKLTKGEKQLEKLKKGSEELRGQVLCLQEEKKGLAGAVDEHQLFVARHRIEMERLENKIKEQEEKMSNCQAQSSENTQGIEAIQSSLDNSERLRNTWHFYDDFKKWYHSTQSVQRPYSRIGLYRTNPRFY